MNLYLLYFFTGSLGGFFGGLLGLGGGIIFVPFLFFIFSHFDIHSTHIMQSAICTSLACIVISSLSSTYKHNKNKLIDWSIFKKMLIGLLIGSTRMKIATKYPKCSIKFMESIGIQSEIIYLHGAQEIAPLLGLSDAIIDLVESGKTLKENGLHEIQVIRDISTRLIANKAALKTKPTLIKEIVEVFS